MKQGMDHLEIMELSLTHVLIAASTVLILLFVSSTVYSWWRLRHVPGPFSAQFTKWWFLKHTLKGSIHLSIGDLSEKYGKDLIHPSTEWV